MRCAALGCQRASGKNGLFCLGHWRKLPPELRAPDRFRGAIAHLGKAEGYLVDLPRTKAALHDNEGQEYV